MGQGKQNSPKEDCEFLGRESGKVSVRGASGRVIILDENQLTDEDRAYLRKVEFREWKSKNGEHSRKARYLQRDGEKVELEYESGKINKVQIDKLSEVDQKWNESPSYEL